MLLALLTGQRTQTIHCLDVNHMDMSDKECIFYLTSLQKHSRPGKQQKPIELEAFDQKPNLCVIRYLKAYVDKTSVHSVLESCEHRYHQIWGPQHYLGQHPPVLLPGRERR